MLILIYFYSTNKYSMVFMNSFHVAMYISKFSTFFFFITLSLSSNAFMKVTKNNCKQYMPPRPTTTHHHPPPSKIYPPPPTTSQNMSTTTHHHPPPVKIFPQPRTTSQNVSTTNYHFPKNGPPPSNN